MKGSECPTIMKTNWIPTTTSTILNEIEDVGIKEIPYIKLIQQYIPLKQRTSLKTPAWDLNMTIVLLPAIYFFVNWLVGQHLFYISKKPVISGKMETYLEIFKQYRKFQMASCVHLQK